MRNRRVGSLLLRLIDGALAGVIGAALAAAVLLQVPSLTGRTVVIIAGGSMAPAIPIGALAVIEPVTPDLPLAPGDVATIRLDASHAVISHRIVRVVDRDGSTWLETRGDANAESDPVLVPASAVVGRIAVAWPELGRWLGAFASRAGFQAIVGLVGTLYALSLLTRRAWATPPRGPSTQFGSSAPSTS